MRKLPHNWRVQVSRILEKQGIDISSVAIANIIRNPGSDLEMLEKIHQAQKQVEKDFAQKLKLQKRIRAASASSLV